MRIEFKFEIDVEPGDVVCGRCQFQSSGYCSLFEYGPRTLREALGHDAPHYRRLPECVEAEKAAKEVSP